MDEEPTVNVGSSSASFEVLARQLWIPRLEGHRLYLSTHRKCQFTHLRRIFHTLREIVDAFLDCTQGLARVVLASLVVVQFHLIF